MGLFSRKKAEKTGSQVLAQEKIFIKKINLNSSRDFTVLRHDLLDGNIMIVNLKPLVKIANAKDGDRRLLSSQIQLIKQYCLQNGGNVTKLEDNTILITPNDQVSIDKGKIQ